MTSNPILVEVHRGPQIESRHSGAFAVCRPDGSVVASGGDIDAPILPRSAVKAIQALPLVESGAARAYGFGARELALVCSSHSAEPVHVDTVRQMLEAAGLSDAALECGGHWSFKQRVLLAQAREMRERPGPAFNNCSGKHTGFLCTCAHEGVRTEGYVRPDHTAMRVVREALEEVLQVPHEDEQRAVDGCSIPTYAVPLRALAGGFARMATGDGLTAGRADAARTLLDGCMAEPLMMAGTGRFCTVAMEAVPGRLFAKTGAEGVFCGALPELGLGVALKCDDGATRASEVMMAAIARALLGDDRLTSLAEPTVRNWNGWEVGRIRPTADLTDRRT